MDGRVECGCHGFVLQRKKARTADAAAAMDYSPTKADNKTNVIGGEAETERKDRMDGEQRALVEAA